MTVALDLKCAKVFFMDFRDLSNAKAFAQALGGNIPLRVYFDRFKRPEADAAPISERQQNRSGAGRKGASLVVLRPTAQTAVTHAEMGGSPPLQAIRNSDIC